MEKIIFSTAPFRKLKQKTCIVCSVVIIVGIVAIAVFVMVVECVFIRNTYMIMSPSFVVTVACYIVTIVCDIAIVSNMLIVGIVVKSHILL